MPAHWLAFGSPIAESVTYRVQECDLMR